MIPLEQCKKILNKGKRKYSEEEIIKIREFLYFIAEIENNDFNTDNYECDYLLPS